MSRPYYSLTGAKEKQVQIAWSMIRLPIRLFKMMIIMRRIRTHRTYAFQKPIEFVYKQEQQNTKMCSGFEQKPQLQSFFAISLYIAAL